MRKVNTDIVSGIAEEELRGSGDLGGTAGVIRQQVSEGERVIAVEADDVVLGCVIDWSRFARWSLCHPVWTFLYNQGCLGTIRPARRRLVHGGQISCFPAGGRSC